MDRNPCVLIRPLVALRRDTLVVDTVENTPRDLEATVSGELGGELHVRHVPLVGVSHFVGISMSQERWLTEAPQFFECASCTTKAYTDNIARCFYWKPLCSNKSPLFHVCLHKLR